MIVKPLLISLSPNTSKEDVLLALRLIFKPRKWLFGSAISGLEGSFQNYFRAKYAVSFNSGRSALFAILKCLDIKESNEVLLQAFTCVAVPNAVLWCGAKPIFVDIKKEDFNMDPHDLKRKITPNSKVIIVQHTFGQPAEMDKILLLAQKHGLDVIEDCAHALGAKYKGKKVGTLGKAAFFSFGRDKVISSVFGGMAITNDRKLGEELVSSQQSFKFPSYFFIVRQLFHPIAFSVILPLYNFLNIGKVLLVVLQKLKLLSFPVYEEEKFGGKPEDFPAKLPDALAVLASSQFERLEDFIKHKREIVDFYYKNLRMEGIILPQILKDTEPTFLRFTVRAKHAGGIRDFAKKRGILLGNWYRIVSPEDVSLGKIGYKQGSCPVAEKVASESLNLPTHPRMSLSEAKRVIDVIKQSSTLF